MRCKKKNKIKGGPQSALIVVEDKSSEEKKEGCEEAEYPGDIHVYEISHRFCI